MAIFLKEGGWMLWSGDYEINLPAVKIFAVLIQYFDYNKLRMHKKVLDFERKPN